MASSAPVDLIAVIVSKAAEYTDTIVTDSATGELVGITLYMTVVDGSTYFTARHAVTHDPLGILRIQKDQIEAFVSYERAKYRGVGTALLQYALEDNVFANDLLVVSSP